MKTQRNIMLVILSAFFLCSCATTTYMSPKDKTEVHKVAIQKKIEVAPHLYYMSSKANMSGMLGGPLGLLLVKNSIEQDEEALKASMKHNNINIDQIVRNAFTKQLAENTNIKITSDQRKSDAILEIAIPVYGVSVPNGFTAKVVPLIRIEAKLIRNNRVIWQSVDYNTPAGSEVAGQTLEDIAKQPNILRDMLTAQTNIIVKRMTSTL